MSDSKNAVEKAAELLKADSRKPGRQYLTIAEAYCMARALSAADLLADASDPLVSTLVEALREAVSIYEQAILGAIEMKRSSSDHSVADTVVAELRQAIERARAAIAAAEGNAKELDDGTPNATR